VRDESLAEMYVADQLQQIGLFLTEDRFVPVLEKVTVPVVATVEADAISGQ